MSDKRNRNSYLNEQDDEKNSDELEMLDNLDDVDKPTEGLDGYEEDADVPENFSEDDLVDDSTEYSEAELHDEQRAPEHEVEDLNLGKALYYEKDQDYEHMDGTGFEDDVEALEDELDDEDEVAEQNPGPGAERSEDEAKNS